MRIRKSESYSDQDGSGQPADEIYELEPWFHNLHLPGGIQTAPSHPLGDYPASAWARVKERLPQDMSGWRVLDVGCNAGYFCFELARMGAEVIGCDRDPHCVRQGQWAADKLGLSERVQFRQMHVYELARAPDRYDMVVFMGAFYPLRYPILALDILAERAEKMLIMQPSTVGQPPGRERPKDALQGQGPQPGGTWPAPLGLQANGLGQITPAILEEVGFQVDAHTDDDIYICQRQETHGRAARRRASPDPAELAAAVGPRYHRIERDPTISDLYGPN